MSKSELKRIKSQTDFNSIEILEAHNKWRRGADIEMQSPYLIGLAIDEALDALKKITELEGKLKAFEWQPIETAPKDGTEVLAYLLDETLFFMTVISWENEWINSFGDEIGSSIPLLWMPLPTPPKP